MRERAFVAIGDEIRRLLGDGLSVREVAFRLALAPNTVAYHRDRVAPAPRGPVPDQRHTVEQVRTRTAVQELLAQGCSQAEIARVLGIGKATVSYHVRRLGKPRDERAARRYDWSAVQAFYDAGHSKRDCERAFGFSSASWHAAVKRGALEPRPQGMPVEQLFASQTTRNRLQLKRVLLRLGLRDCVCASCGLTEWRGEPLSLALHHINGDRHDNRVDNLELLCPNCHSQTHNFAGRNRRERAA